MRPRQPAPDQGAFTLAEPTVSGHNQGVGSASANRAIIRSQLDLLPSWATRMPACCTSAELTPRLHPDAVSSDRLM